VPLVSFVVCVCVLFVCCVCLLVACLWVVDASFCVEHNHFHREIESVRRSLPPHILKRCPRLCIIGRLTTLSECMLLHVLCLVFVFGLCLYVGRVSMILLADLKSLHQ
jgi:hypothetical protein